MTTSSYRSLFSLLSIAAFFLLASRAHIGDVKCGHGQEDFAPEFLDIEEDTSAFDQGRVLQSTTYPNMRIYGYYDFLPASGASTSYIAYIRDELAPPVISFLQSALRVKAPVVGNFKLSTSTKTVCSKTTPTILTTTGVPADHIVFFDSRVEDSSTVASSGFCYQASGTKRPLISKTNFNRNMLIEAKGDILLHEKNMYLLIHEMMHSLGFSDGLYKYYIDETGKTRTGHVKSLSIAGKTRIVVDVPPLTDRLRNYYGCSTIPGGIMENDGGDGTAGSHFERKFFVYETMSSGGIYGRRVSEFSLALLEGSGWYAPDYTYAEPYFYGQGQGCTFVTGTCSTSTASFDEFCIGSSRGCAPQGRSGGQCSSDSKADGCRYVDPDTDYDCENPDAISGARLASLQVYGRDSNSKCFTGDLNSKSSTSKTSFCFKYNCVGTGSSTELQVLLGSTTATCKQEGKLSVSGYYGSIDCPDPLTFCNTVGKKYCPRGCMGRGQCVDSKCQCNSGFTGIDCGLKA